MQSSSFIEWHSLVMSRKEDDKMSANDIKDTKKLQASFVTPASNTNPLADPAHIDYQIHESTVTDEISERTFQDVRLCYQCGKSSAGWLTCTTRGNTQYSILITHYSLWRKFIDESNYKTFNYFPGSPKYFGRVREDLLIQEKNLNSLPL